MRDVVVLLGLVGALSCPFSACAAFVFRMGDTVYVDGKQYSWEEWKKIRDSRPASAPEASTVTGVQQRAGTCTTPIYYEQFPADDDKFECTAGLGLLTRGEILDKGWKIDFIEKIPPPTGQPAQSPRGLPLNLYKFVISR